MARSSAPWRPTVPSVNYHLWQPCNMRCRFCFATFQGMRREILPEGHLNRADALRIVDEIAAAGFLKINFAGGEPFLCPWLDELVARAKHLGMAVSVVTNGSYFVREDQRKLLSRLDWLVLSVDSVVPATLRRIGRVAAHKPMSEDAYLDICRQVKNAGVNLKINTVVTTASLDEDLTGFILKALPQRWKIMQMLLLDGPDSRRAEDLAINKRQFKQFLKKNAAVKSSGVLVVPEANKDMVGSYAMIDPAGRFYDNVAGEYRYSRPILDVGVQAALSEVSISRKRFLSRGGLYDFARNRAAEPSLPRRLPQPMEPISTSSC